MRYSPRTQRRHLIWASTLTALHQAAETAVPIVIGLVIDRAVARSDGTVLIVWIAVLVAVFAVLTVAMRTGLRNGTRGIEGTGHALRILLVRRVLDPRGTATTGQSAGELLSTSSVDAAGVGLYNSGVRPILSAAGARIVAAAVLFTVSIPLGLPILVALPPCCRCPPVRAYSRAVDAALASVRRWSSTYPAAGADEVVVLVEGRVTERGTQQELRNSTANMPAWSAWSAARVQ